MSGTYLVVKNTCWIEQDTVKKMVIKRSLWAGGWDELVELLSMVVVMLVMVLVVVVTLVMVVLVVGGDSGRDTG